jgi:hypothetical protein
MATTYREWIAANVTGNVFGKCYDWSCDMADAFPELRLVRGHYYCTAWGERAHWWLVAPDGSIVDPTAEQFPSRGAGEYIELDLNAPVPTGKCLNCGELVYQGDSVCSPECYAATVSFLNSYR